MRQRSVIGDTIAYRHIRGIRAIACVQQVQAQIASTAHDGEGCIGSKVVQSYFAGTIADLPNPAVFRFRTLMISTFCTRAAGKAAEMVDASR